MRIFIRLVPLLLIYALVFAGTDLPESARSDAVRYLWFAENLTQGFYSPQVKINLWNGPGYPMVLVFTVGLNLPLITARLINIAFMFLAAVYFYLTLRQYVRPPTATIATYALGLWPPALKMLTQIMAEPVSLFLVCGFVFHLSRVHQRIENRRVHLAVASVYLGYLALTRVIFGYVILAALLVLLVVYLIRRTTSLRRDILVCCLALLVCLPYLFYTYSLTGRVFYWSMAGGMSLYWMSSPYEGELGDWHTMRATTKQPELTKNHGAFLAELGKLSLIERDDALKHKAIQNIREHPAKYFRNWVANLGRLAINYPKSYTDQKPETLLDIIPSMVALIMFCLCIPSVYSRSSQIPHELWVLLLIALIYLGGTSLVSAFQRFQLPLVPIGFLWISFVVARKA
jgi:hypothetical protein